MKNNYIIRRFIAADAPEVRNIICRGLREVNGRDYPAERIERCCNVYTIEKILSQAENTHMYVAVSETNRILGTGSIAPYFGSETESILLTIYVMPELIGSGIGTAIIKKLETDEYFLRASRIEIPASVTAMTFYRKMGYLPKDGQQKPDEEGLFRMVKFR